MRAVYFQHVKGPALSALATVLIAAAPAAAAGKEAPGASSELSPTKSLPGVRYLVLESGPETGEKPGRNSAVRVRYETRLPDGKVVDASPLEGRIFPLKAMIPGFQAALLQMRPGDAWRVWVPPELAYGANGPAPVGGVELVFEIELLEAAPLPPSPPPYLTEMPR